MIDQHPITPPPELVQQWMTEAHDQPPGPDVRMIATQAAQWGADQQLKLEAEQIAQAYQAGADQELEACCEWLCPSNGNYYADVAVKLRAARRPKPPSLKEQALAELEFLRGDANSMGMGFDAPAIRRALEALPND
jgi:hypothetical protein